ncbi:MAG: acetyltransferase [Acidimicrobiales bacterium]|nr:acetyltransferase [Acidimicrobiales bacterium]
MATGDAASQRPLVLYGAGGFARETAALVDALNATRPSWELLGFLDDDPEREGALVSGRPVLGGMGWLVEHPSVSVTLCVGNPANYASRAALAERLRLDDHRYATLVHPMASVASGCQLGAGSVVHATSTLTCDVQVGRHVAIMPGVVLTHDDEIEDFVTFGAGVRVAGGVRVERGSYLGSGALVRERCTIGEWALVGMGAIVTRTIPPGEIWVGQPARYLRPGPHAALVDVERRTRGDGS